MSQDIALDMSAAANGWRTQAALIALTISIGFLPTVVTSELFTGVSQTVGLTGVFTVAYLSPHPIVAAMLGAGVMALEALMLPRIGMFLDSAPTVREVGRQRARRAAPGGAASHPAHRECGARGR